MPYSQVNGLTAILEPPCLHREVFWAVGVLGANAPRGSTSKGPDMHLPETNEIRSNQQIAKNPGE